ncbi:MAG: phosphoglucosamine mutase [Planctomycetes bacterium]|nr:phosphoglucosamine mutase [Planctomycetota bacterium]
MATATNELIVSVSGIRGIIGAGLSPATALLFAQALGTHVNGGRVVLSRDSRPSGAMLQHAVIAGLQSCGCEIHDLGITPTPTVGLAVRQLGAAGAIQITASHNPAPWNGMKLFGPDGAVLSPAKGQEIKQIFDTASFALVSHDRLGEVCECNMAEDWHRAQVLQLVDTVRISAGGFRVFLDANGGAGGPLGKALLDSLQVEHVLHGGQPDGEFTHKPEPIEENLTTILPLVAQYQANAGFVLDPDADRLAIIDETGHYIGEELTLALATLCRLRQQRGPIAINMSSSRVNEDIAKQFGVVCHRSAVGEANVVAKMREVNAVIGGEGNGGVIDPRIGWVRDPFIGMALILQLLVDSGKTLSQIVGELPPYTIVKDKYDVSPEGLPKLYAALAARWPDATPNRLDGLRLDWPNRWVHVRPSNTEPIVRVIAEAPDAEAARTLCKEVGSLLAKS